MKYTILHISDIHKSKDVQYNSLLQSLKKDLDTYVNEEGIQKPSFIVVSGDLIQGAYTDAEIRQQYNDVEEFLIGICKMYLDKDRSRMVIVPGNHDVNRAASKASLLPSSKGYNVCKDDFFNGSDAIRWSWSDDKFYEIQDLSLYEKRFDLFVEFYDRFYDGIRCYPQKHETDAYTIVNDKYKVCFACFNSCNHLDHLCDTGCISQDAIISVGPVLNECYNAGYLNIAVWHHNLYGRPLATNYLDRSLLGDLLCNDVHIGLYGHQHFTQIAEEYSDLLLSKDEATQKLLLISAGTLFGGKRELSDGDRRQYNVIEVNVGDGIADIDINIREDINRNPYNKIPHWATKALPNSSNKIHYQVKLRKLSLNEQVLNIDKKARLTSDYIEACEALKEIEAETGENMSRFIKAYLKEIKDYEYVLNNIREVEGPEDAILMIVAAKESGSKFWIDKVSQDERIKNLKDPLVSNMLQTLK